MKSIYNAVISTQQRNCILIGKRDSITDPMWKYSLEIFRPLSEIFHSYCLQMHMPLCCYHQKIAMMLQIDFCRQYSSINCKMIGFKSICCQFCIMFSCKLWYSCAIYCDCFQIMYTAVPLPLTHYSHRLPG